MHLNLILDNFDLNCFKNYLMHLQIVNVPNLVLFICICIFFFTLDGNLFSATVADFSSMDPIIYKEQLQTEQYDSLSLNGNINISLSFALIIYIRMYIFILIYCVCYIQVSNE
jgi:hypothetical protein